MAYLSKDTTWERWSRQICTHSSRNQGVKLSPPCRAISLCRASELTQRQSRISSELTLIFSPERPMYTEHSSCSAAVASNCARYRNLNKNCSGQHIPSSSCSRRCVAASIVSPLHGWLQQLFDQYNGHSRL